ncbi:MAG TPA: glycosyltransferase family A protein [Tepidisphaeraceae bacterium]|jgi:GT2 family glycosyltransferase
MPKVSVITPCFNAARFVGQTIESVAAQTLADWEHVVVDDGSTDGSAAVVEAACRRDLRVRLVRQPNRGVCAARNTGFRASDPASQYLLFLDADDCLEPRMLEVLVGYLDARPTVGVAYCDYSLIDASSHELSCRPPVPRYVPWGLGLRKLPPSEPRTPLVSIIGGAPVYESLSVIRRSVYVRTPGWNEGLGQHHEGVELFARLALLEEVHFVSERLYRYRQHAGQSSRDYSKSCRQTRSLVDRLLGLGDTSSSARREILAAMWFCHGRMGPWTGIVSGIEHARKGQLILATRFIFGGAWRYAASLLPFKTMMPVPWH